MLLLKCSLEESGFHLRITGHSFRGLDVNVAISGAEQHEAHQLYVSRGGQGGDGGFDSDFGGFLDGIATGSRGDGGEGERVDSVVIGEADGLAVATGQDCGLIVVSAAINGTDRVDDVFGWKAASRREDCFACGETAGLHFGYDAFAFFEDGGSSGAVDGAIDTASAEEGRVGGIDDGLGGLFGDVGGAVEVDELVVGEGEFGGEVGHDDH